MTIETASPILWGFATSVGCPAAVAQLVECVLGKDEVKGSNPFSSSCGLSSFVCGVGVFPPVVCEVVHWSVGF